MAAKGGTVFRGTVLRLDVKIPRFGLPWIQFNTTIGSGFPEALNSAALVIGPTGVGLGRNGVLYVADTLANRVAGFPTRSSAASVPDAASPSPGTSPERPAWPGSGAGR